MVSSILILTRNHLFRAKPVKEEEEEKEPFKKLTKKEKKKAAKEAKKKKYQEAAQGPPLTEHPSGGESEDSLDDLEPLGV